LSAPSLKGHLLVASPRMSDENFDRTIVFLIEHNHGAVGVVLNRPGESAVQEHLPGWWDLASPPAVVFRGGPVQPTHAICLGISSDGEPRAGFQPILGELGVVDLAKPPDEAGVVRLRVFAGYSGWAPGQLEDELEAGGWFVAAAETSDVVSTSPGSLWRTVLRRQADPALVALAGYPADPSLN